MSKRIWFNRTFATASHYVDMIRSNPDGQEFTIYATHPKHHSLMLQAADYAQIEPTLPMDEYVNYCLEFCKKHQIDIFIPHFGLKEIAAHKPAFAAQGTKVMLSGDARQMEIVSDKGTLFEKLQGIEGLVLPQYFVVKTVEQFKDAYETLRGNGHQVCFKPVTGEGGAGFWIVDEHPRTLSSLYQSAAPHISLEDVLKLLSTESHFESLMVMEYMGGHEYSVDCLATPEKILAAVPRKKLEGRIRELEENQYLIDMAHAIHGVLPLQYNYNIQFIMQGESYKLLELNPRTSGGLYMSCLSGINFPYLAVQLLLGQEVHVPKPDFNILATHIEKEILIKNRIFGLHKKSR